MTSEAGTRQELYRECGIALFFFFLSFLTRFPHFFRAVYDWDESTYILMGQSVLDGDLPYTGILDLKPPLLWWTFGAILGILGKSVVAFRIGGTICVAVSAYLLYRAGRNFFEPGVGVLAGTLWILIIGVCPGGVATMSEHIALPPLILSLLLVSAPEVRSGRGFLAGLAMGAACMIRINLAYAAILLGIGILIRRACGDPKVGLWRSIIDSGFLHYALGGVLMSLATVVPYLITNAAGIWWNGVVTASLAYSGSQRLLEDVLIRQMQLGFQAPFYSSMSPSLAVWYAVWVGAGLGVARMIYEWRRTLSTGSVLLLFLLGGVQLSIMAGGVFYAHHFLQLAPASCLIASFFGLRFFRECRPEAVLILTLLFLEFGFREYRDYRSLLSREQPLAQFGRPHTVAELLRAENPDLEPVWLLNDQLAYFLSGSPPAHRIVHPSSLKRDFLIRTWLGPESNKRTELEKILDRRPLFIIGSHIDNFYSEPLRSYFRERLKVEYRREEDLDGLQVYRRL